MPAGNGFWVVKLGRAPLPITRGRMGTPTINPKYLDSHRW